MDEGCGTHFDPRLLDTFLSLLPEMNAIAQTVLDNEDDGRQDAPVLQLRQTLDSMPCCLAQGQ